jgi:hypothetical protein
LEEIVKGYRCVIAFGLIPLAGWCGVGCTSAQSNESGRQRIVGAWRLESRTVRKGNGEIVLDPVLGKSPAGRLFYDASGHMSLQMMRQERTEPMSVPSNPEDAKNPRVVLGYDSYFGTFDVNDADGTVTHHVEGSLFPEDLGKDFKRLFTIDGDALTLKFTSRSAEGGEITRTLLFRRSR